MIKLIEDWVGGERFLTTFRDDWGRNSRSGSYRNGSLEFLNGSQTPNMENAVKWMNRHLNNVDGILIPCNL